MWYIILDIFIDSLIIDEPSQKTTKYIMWEKWILYKLSDSNGTYKSTCMAHTQQWPHNHTRSTLLYPISKAGKSKAPLLHTSWTTPLMLWYPFSYNHKDFFSLPPKLLTYLKFRLTHSNYPQNTLYFLGHTYNNYRSITYLFWWIAEDKVPTS